MAESLKEDGRPAQQWYWDDWFSEFGLRLCSLAARGLWIDMLGIMFKAEIRGTLAVNGRQINGKSLAKICNTSEQNIDKYLDELEEQEVFSRLEDGTIINRRMFNESNRKEEISKIRSAAGKEGAKKRWQKGNKDNNKKMAKIAASSPSSSPTPTSISSSKEKEDFVIPEWIPKEEFEEYKKMRQKIKKPMTDRAIELAVKKLDTLKSEGYDPQQVLEQSILNSWQGLFPLKDDRKEYQPSQVGRSTKKTTPEQDKYYKARQEKEKEIKAKYKKEISDIRKTGDKEAWDILQDKMAEEAREWSINYRESKGGQE